MRLRILDGVNRECRCVGLPAAALAALPDLLSDFGVAPVAVLELPGFDVVAVAGPASAFVPAITWLTDSLPHLARDIAGSDARSETRVGY
jgi:hypothetical protein